MNGLLNKIVRINFIKSLLLNLRVFPLKDALKLHMLVYRNVNIKLMGGGKNQIVIK